MDFKALTSYLQQLLLQNNAQVASMASLDIQALNYKTGVEHWSALECIEHLNRYAAYYNPLLTAAGDNFHFGTDSVYKKSWLGHLSIKSIHPDNRKKSKTIKRMNPVNSELDNHCIDTFLHSQTQLETLVAQGDPINFNKKVIPVEFFKFLKLGIGETLEFILLHQKRHLIQAKEMLHAFETKKAQLV